MRWIKTFLGVIGFLFLLIPFVYAAGSGAYRLEVPDAAALGKGGTSVGEANTPAAVFYNPAGMTQIDKAAISVGAALIQPKARCISDDTNTKTKMQQDSFIIPSVFYVSRLGMENLAFGIGATSSWGLGTEWAQDSFARYSATRTLMQNEDYSLTTAYKFTDQFSLGVGVDIDNSKLDKQKKLNMGVFNAGDSDGNFKLKADNTAAGVRLAGMYKLNDNHQFGLMYRSEIRRKYHGKVYLDGLSATAQAMYNFSGSSYQTDVVSKSTLPQSVVFGYSYKPNSKLTLNTDIEWMDWSSTKKEELAYPSETDTSGAFGGRLGYLNTGNPANRDWHDAFSLGLGAEYKLAERLRVRGGYFFHQTPIPQATFEPNLPDSNSHTVTTGFGYDITKSLTFDLAYAAMFFEARPIKNTANVTFGGNVSGKYEQWISMVSATATYRF